MKRFILLHYSEIGLKKANKGYFVDKLRKQIKEKLEKRFRQTFVVSEILSRIIIPLQDGFVEEEYVKVLRKIFGVKNFQFVYEGVTDIELIADQIWNNMPADLLSAFGNEIKTFCVRVKRSQELPLTSIEFEREIGAILLRHDIALKVKLKDMDFLVSVEFFNEHGYFSYKKYSGIGGMSANSGGKLVSLISNGIDSPVAAYKMMRRGARVIFAHFHSYPYTEQKDIENLKKLVGILSDYQFDTKLYLIPFAEIQKAIATNLDIPGNLRVVLYRRIMIRIAERIAKKDKAKGLITGDSYAQVASQTSGNLFAVHDASSIPLFQPLIAYDKEEIIMLAREIETFDISKLPCGDTCTMFVPKHPELNASIYDLRRIEEALPIDEWVEQAFSSAEIIFF